MSDRLRGRAIGTNGSQGYFKQHWLYATEQDYAYPRPIPRTQWDLFEREKARLIDRFLRKCPLPGRLVLEYGCGSAGMSAYLANHGLRAIATDVNAEALEAALANWKENGDQVSRTVFMTAYADALQLPFRDSVFDIVMSHGLLEHFDRDALTRSFGEAGRVLRPGGILLGDIVHGNFSVRTVATWLNFVASFGYHTMRGQFRTLPSLYTAYFHPFYENTLDLAEWQECLEAGGFVQVEMLATRPFPPLAVTGRFEKLYIDLMERMLPFYRWFDESQSWLSKRWGWAYLFRAVKL